MTFSWRFKNFAYKIVNSKGEKKMDDKDKIINEIIETATKSDDCFKGGEEEKFSAIAELIETFNCKNSDEDEEQDSEEIEDDEDAEESKKSDNAKKKSVKNSRYGRHYQKINEVYNASNGVTNENIYLSRAEKLSAAEKYFKKGE